MSNDNKFTDLDSAYGDDDAARPPTPLPTVAWYAIRALGLLVGAVVVGGALVLYRPLHRRWNARSRLRGVSGEIHPRFRMRHSNLRPR